MGARGRAVDHIAAAMVWEAVREAMRRPALAAPDPVAREITMLCRLARFPHLAAGYIASGVPVVAFVGC